MVDNVETPAVTTESLLAQLETEKAAHQITQGELSAALEKHADAAGALDEAAGIITGQKETITALQARINDLETKPASYPVIEVNKKKYEVQVKAFKYKGRNYTVAELLADKALQKELVGIGAGFIIEKTA